MDEIDAFFDNPAAHRKKIMGPLTNAYSMGPENNYSRREDHKSSVVYHGTDYSKEAKAKERQMYLRIERERELGGNEMAGLQSLEHLSSMLSLQDEAAALNDEALAKVYGKYSYKSEFNKGEHMLEIDSYKQEILSQMKSNPVIVIQGPTGCGKTTQVPQWILDDCYESRKPCKIVVTQPRRIAAISIAQRVAHERGWDVGGVVGYQVALDSHVSEDTKILYVTTGVLLQKLVNTKDMSEYTHIILDEVHERGQEMDFLLLIVKRLLFTKSTNTKVVLMSATINAKTFTEYFTIPTDYRNDVATCIKIESKMTAHTVRTYYLNDILKKLSVSGQHWDEHSLTIPHEKYDLVIKLLNAFDTIDMEEAVEDEDDEPNGVIPSVLIFLPGINEIEDLYGKLTDPIYRLKLITREPKWWVLPLHSTITAEEQIRVFKRAPAGYRKVILSTNIAESSITVSDIKYVIDFCLLKELVADEDTNFTSLQLAWASKTNCEQRAGRAGRVRDGRIYRLVNEMFYYSLKKECKPEIQRCSLERLVLLAKMLDIGSPADILALAMDPPDLSNIHRTILVLKEVGCLKNSQDPEDMVSIDGDITFLGRICGQLPLDVRASKLIVLGYIYGCFQECIIMAAAMSVKNMFSSPFQERLNSYNSRLTWADGSTSDAIAFHNVYKVWIHLRKQRQLKSAQEESKWARQFFIQLRCLRELDDLVRELTKRLSRLGIEADKKMAPWSHRDIPLVLKIVLAGAFYPHYFSQPGGDEGKEREAFKVLSGHDPRNTVYLKDFPADQPGQLYARTIKKYIGKLIGEEPLIYFDGNSNKVFLTFDESSLSSSQQEAKNKARNPAIPGRVLLPVYKAVKINQLRIPIRVPLLRPDHARQLLESYPKKDSCDVMVPCLPGIEETVISLRISHFINCGHFWIQNDEYSEISKLNAISKSLQCKLLPNTEKICSGDLFAAPYEDTSGHTAMYRVRVVNLMPNDMVWVFYIDYGSYSRVHHNSLRLLPKGICSDIPPLALECVMAEIAPSLQKNLQGEWTPEATKFFQQVISNSRGLLGQIYSIFNGVISLTLITKDTMKSVNKLLIEKGFAQPAEENYQSKMNHDFREMYNDVNMNIPQMRAFNKQQENNAIAYQQCRDMESPEYKDCVTEVILKGPFSPLESSLCTLMYGSKNKSVNVDWSSVNSVLIDTEPQLTYERLLVAAAVGQSQDGGRLTLRHTTMMPSIPGLPAILGILFSPKCELRRDPTCTRYVSVLCGLGALPDRRPLFPEHEMLLPIDADITFDDLQKINHIRSLMDYLLYCEPEQDLQCIDEQTRIAIPSRIKEVLTELLWRRRKPRETYALPNAWEWGLVPDEEFLECDNNDMTERQTVYPLHQLLPLNLQTPDEINALKTYTSELKKAVTSTGSCSRQVVCKLCGTEPLSIQSMRIHLYSQSHREREEDLDV